MAGERRNDGDSGLGLMDRYGHFGRTLRMGIPISGKIGAACVKYDCAIARCIFVLLI